MLNSATSDILWILSTLLFFSEISSLHCLQSASMKLSMPSLSYLYVPLNTLSNESPVDWKGKGKNNKKNVLTHIKVIKIFLLKIKGWGYLTL